jgi:hypothetical protein
MEKYELTLVGDSIHLEEFREFARDRTDEYFLGIMCRPGMVIKDFWVKANVMMTEEEANFVVLKFGVQVRKINETEV